MARAFTPSARHGRYAPANRFQAGRLLPLVVVPMFVGVFGLAFLAAVEPKYAFVLIAAAIAILVALIKPVPILVLAFPAAFVSIRVGPPAIDMSVADAVTVLATLAALPHVPWRNRRLQLVLVLGGFYLAAVCIAVAANFSTAAAAEIGHRAIMIFGALMIGSALAVMGKSRLALRAFVITGVVIALGAVADTLQNGFTAAYPFGMHKNFAGPHLTSCLLVFLAAGPMMGFKRMVQVPMVFVLFGGLLATQSRGAALGLVGISAFYMLRSRNRRVARLAPVVLVVSAILLTFAIVTFNDQAGLDNTKYNSYNTRVEGYSEALDVAWMSNVVVGSGPKWFRTAGYGSGPHNIVVAELSETGLLGFVAMAVFLGAVVMMLWRIRRTLADAALLVMLERIVDSMLGIFWVAGTGTTPWLFTGLAIGDTERDDDEDDEDVSRHDEQPLDLAWPDPIDRSGDLAHRRPGAGRWA